jgi:hypothetical protein
MAYVFQLITPRLAESDEMALELARIKLAEEKQRTRQSHEETKRLEVVREIVVGQQATTRQAMELAEWALSSRNAAVGRAFADDELRKLRTEKAADLAREIELGKHGNGLLNVDQKKNSRTHIKNNTNDAGSFFTAKKIRA